MLGDEELGRERPLGSMFPPNQLNVNMIFSSSLVRMEWREWARGAWSGTSCEHLAIDYPAAATRELGESRVGKKMGTNKCLVKQLLCLYVFPHFSQ